MFLDAVRTRLLSTTSERGAQIRLVASIFLFFLSAILLGYSVYFFYVFQSYHSTTAYFPWAWDTSIKSATSVDILTALGVILSVVVGGISLGAVFFLRNEIESLRNEHYLPSANPENREKTLAVIILFVVGLVLTAAGIDIGFSSGIWSTGSQFTTGGGTAFGVWGSIALGLVSVATSIVWKMMGD